MKKALMIILVLSLLFALFTQVFANEIDTIPWKRLERDVESNYNVMWSGKEWITTKYPPSVSVDKVNFTLIPPNDEIKDTLGNTSYGYLWTGNDYLVYHTHHYYGVHDHQKYMYRISADMSTLLNTYEIPNWINQIEIINGVCYISTENVYPVYLGDTNRVGGEWRGDFQIYYSDDYVNWTSLDFEFDVKRKGYIPSMHLSDGRLFIVDYYNNDLKQYSKISRNVWTQNSNRDFCEVLYENIQPTPIGKIGDYLYTQPYTDEANSDILLSKDGIYWTKVTLPEKAYVQNVFEDEGKIVVHSKINNRSVYDYCETEDIYSEMAEYAKKEKVYVQFQGKILGFEQPPVLESDRTLVPMRFLFEQMGAEVTWDDSTQMATATMNDTAVTFGINNTTAKVNNTNVSMDVPARLINDKTMVPLRFLSEELGYTVTWDEETNTAIIE